MRVAGSLVVIIASACLVIFRRRFAQAEADNYGRYTGRHGSERRVRATELIATGAGCALIIATTLHLFGVF
jgi:hypothetical protein